MPAIDENGDIAPFANMFFFLSNTDVPAVYYLDAEGETEGPFPLPAQGDGRFPAAYLNPSTIYRVRLETGIGEEIFDIDPVSGVDLGMVQSAAAEAVAAKDIAVIQAGIATGKAAEAATALGLTIEAKLDTFEARDETTAALATAQALMIDGKAFSKPTLAAAVTQALANVPDGETFAASGSDVTYWALYRNVAGVATELWKMPKALLTAAAIPTITASRSLAITDMIAPLAVPVAIDGPEGMLATLMVPSNSVDPLPIGSIGQFVNTTGRTVVITTDATGDSVVSPALPGKIAALPGSVFWVEKRGLNDFFVFGQLYDVPAGAFSVKVFLDPSALDTMKQERTGAAATTPAAVGQPVGTIRNRGTVGGYAVASADDRRPILRQDGTGRHYLETDGVNDFLLLDAVPMNMARLHWALSFKALAYGFARGIMSAGRYDTSGDLHNDAFSLSQNALNPVPADFTFQMGVAPNRMAVGLQGVAPKHPRVWEYKRESNATPAEMRIDNMRIVSSGSPTAIPALGTVTAMVTATIQIVIGANHGNAGQGNALQFSATAYYGLIMDDTVQTDAQRAAIRAYQENRTYLAPPWYPAFNDLTGLEAARTTLINEITLGAGIPADLATLAIDPAPFMTLTNLSKVEKATIPGSTAKPRLWTPIAARTDVVGICIAGHAATAAQNGLRDFSVQPFISAGIPVATIVLPRGPNDYTSGDPTQHFGNRPPYSEWTRQVNVMTNTLLDIYPGAEVITWGISGGAWTTMLCAAMDARIKKSVQFVGSIPEFIYVNVDWEQWHTEISASYLDLYLLASASDDDDREHYDVKHEGDEAGFNRAAYSSRPPYAQGMADRAAALGGKYEMVWFDQYLHALAAADRDLLLGLIP